jgi:predicted phage terminase large subunit-like protein
MTVETITRNDIKKKLAALSENERARLAALMAPRIVEPYVKHIPHPAQMVYLSLNVREALYGGAAGGGKSDALLMAALQYVDVPGYSALILRRTWPDLVLPGAIMDRAKSWLANTPAKMHDGGRSYTFPSGAKLQFGYLARDDDKFRYQSAEFQFIGFDELTQWDREETYDYMFSRIRRPAISCLNCNTNLARETTPGRTHMYKHTTALGRLKCGKNAYPDPAVLAQYPDAPDGVNIFNVPLRMRSATNPGGRGAHWVKARLVDPRTKRKKAVFIPARLMDNPSLDQETYRENLMHLSPVERERLLNGDWEITEGGDMFERTDFYPTEHMASAQAKRVRFWDMAASDGDRSDWTVGALCALEDGVFTIEHIVRVRKKPHETEKLLAQTAQMDGLNVHIRMEQEGGSAGKAIIDSYRRGVFQGYNFDGIKSTGSKEARASALASYAKNNSKNVRMVIAGWNRDFLDEFELFPNGAHDDIVDSTASAYNYLSFGRKQVRILV